MSSFFRVFLVKDEMRVGDDFLMKDLFDFLRTFFDDQSIEYR